MVTRSRRRAVRPSPKVRLQIAEVFDRLGGSDAMVEWVEASEENRKAFYCTIYPRLAPVEAKTEEKPEVTKLTLRFI